MSFDDSHDVITASLPCVQKHHQLFIDSAEEAKKLVENRLPDSQFKLVHKIGRKHAEEVEVLVDRANLC
jgi:hypothetical protein